ncbi:tartrate-resistant acid phosphatase type 5-like isoform X2 [Dysidea avara]|uniref:tartrate-resistant acid phosphatase type 5-like isoform X2 n=1 Tax=Dysidea avara TaxID=196820 RepID=UPI00331B9654
MRMQNFDNDDDDDDDNDTLNQEDEQLLDEPHKWRFKRRYFLPWIVIIILFSILLISIILIATLTNTNDGDGEKKLSFLVVGDWGGLPDPPYYTIAQKRVAEQMGRKAEEIGSRFTVGLGDNFYEDGVTNVDDPRFKTTFESRWYMIAGNHDHNRNVTAQMAYTNKSHRWYMPDYNYTENIAIPGSKSKVQFVFVDTVLLTNRNQTCSPPNDAYLMNAQWTWIENTLAASTAQWLFVVGHYPVWSIANHGPTSALVDCLRPLLMKYNVTAYICGHDHTLQHIREQNSSVEYFVSGAGHDSNPSLNHTDEIPPHSLLFHYGPMDTNKTHGGFSYVSIHPTVMHITHVDHDGKELYTYSTRNNRPPIAGNIT